MSALFDLLNQSSKVLLDLDPDGKEKIAELNGKLLCLEVTLPSMTLYLAPTSDGLEILRESDVVPDVTLTGSALAFVKLGGAGVGSGVLSGGQINMKGDAETGQAFQKILSQIDIDGEELLSHYIGDTPARKVGNLFREFGEWATESIDLSRKNTGEYLQEEKRLLVTNLAMERFEKSVDHLRSDVDRLAIRMEQLLQKLKNNNH